MSIQRYDTFGDTDDDGGYVTYADHVAAMDEQAKGRDRIWDRGYDRGVSDECARIKAAVIASAHACDMAPEDMAWRYDALLAIIDGEDA